MKESPMCRPVALQLLKARSVEKGEKKGEGEGGEQQKRQRDARVDLIPLFTASLVRRFSGYIPWYVTS